MNILEVTTLFPRWLGDSRGPIILKITQALQRNGHRVGVVSLHGPKSKTYECWDGIEIYRPRYCWPDRFEILQDTGGGLPAAWEKRPFSRLLFPLLILAQANSIIRHAKGYDVIHAHFTIPAMAAAIGKPLHRLPIVTTVRGSDVYRIPSYRLGKLFNRIALNSSEKVTAMSQDLLSLVRQSGTPSDKLEYTPPPIDTKIFFPGEWKDREPVILYIASLIERKGPDKLIEAFSRIANDLPQYRLVMVGKGPEKERLIQLTDELHLYQRIEFIDYLTQDQVAALLRKVRLFVLPSLEEALGMVVVEALASGVPVVATRVGGVPEAVPPEVGILVDAGDVAGLADGIRAVLMDPDRLQCMGENAIRWVESHFYSHNQNAMHLVRVFESVVSK